MSKTFTYVLIVITVYLLIIFPKLNGGSTSKSDAKSDSKSKSNKTTEKVTVNGVKGEKENGVVKGAAGQLKYRFGFSEDKTTSYTK